MFAKYLADSEFRIVGLSHGVVNKGGHHFSDLVQITGPVFLQNNGELSIGLFINNCT